MNYDIIKDCLVRAQDEWAYSRKPKPAFPKEKTEKIKPKEPKKKLKLKVIHN